MSLFWEIIGLSGYDFNGYPQFTKLEFFLDRMYTDIVLCQDEFEELIQKLQILKTSLNNIVTQEIKSAQKKGAQQKR